MTETAISNIYGLFVGVNRYESEDIRPLSFATADVLAIRDKLADRFGLKYENTTVLADDMENGTTPTRRQILRAMNRFAIAPMQETDIFMFVFAGHGFSCTGQTFLAACDSEIASEALLRETAVSLETVRNFLGQIPAGHQVLIMDACRDAPIKGTRSVGSQAMSGDMTRDIGAVIRTTQSSDVKGRLASAIMCSCWEGQVAHEYEQGGHGWFCHNLLEELNNATPPELSLSDLHSRVKDRMRESAWRLLPAAKDQSPHLLIEGDIPTLRLSAAAEHGHSIRPTSGTAANANDVQSHESKVSDTAHPEVGFTLPRTSVHQEYHDIEEQLLAGRARVVLQSLKSGTALSPHANILWCIAALMVTPIRKLHNKEANELVGQLTELINTPEKPLATLLLMALAAHYYRPLRRRMPFGSIDLNDEDLQTLNQQSRQLVRLVPEARNVLYERNGEKT